VGRSPLSRHGPADVLIAEAFGEAPVRRGVTAITRRDGVGVVTSIVLRSPLVPEPGETGYLAINGFI
jgi:hypothetical protein